MFGMLNAALKRCSTQKLFYPSLSHPKSDLRHLVRVTFAVMRYAFLVETYATERVKVVSVWEKAGGAKAALPGVGKQAVTERP